MSTKRSLKALTNNYDTAGIDNIITGYLPHSIYAFETNTHPNYLKVGDTNRRVEVRLNEWRKIYKDLIKKYEAEAMLEDDKGEKNIFFRDYALHAYLIKDKHCNRLSERQFEEEFFENARVIDVINGITDIKAEFQKDGVKKYNYYQVGEDNTQIENHFAREQDYSPRPNQAQVIENIEKAVNAGRKNLLLYAVMRFGKSNVALWAAKAIKSELTVIVTGKADVKAEWQKAVESHMDFKNFVFTDTSGYTKEFIEENKDQQIVVFTTLQDLAGSRDEVKAKHDLLFKNQIDFLVIDESHFGARAKIYSQAIENMTEDTDFEELDEKDIDEVIDAVNSLNSKVKLHLSGTPYRILLSGEFSEEDIVGKVQFTDILEEKNKWASEHIEDEEEHPWTNPYFGFPEMVRFAFTPNKSSVKLLKELKAHGESAELNVLFAPESTAKSKASKTNFKHESDVLNLLKAIDGSDEDEYIFPFLNYKRIKDGKLAQHMVFVLPFKNSVDAMDRLLNAHKVEFQNLGSYEILNVAGNTSRFSNVSEVQNKIKELASQNKKTITLTVNKMLTGSTVPEWDTMIFLKDTKSPQDYDQAIFRLQSPWIKEIKDTETGEVIGKEDMKPQTLLIDFAPNRMFKIESDRAIVVNASELKSGNDEQEKQLQRNINVSPIIYMNRNKLKEATPTDIIAKIREYSADKSIIDEVVELPVDDSLYSIPDILAEISNQAELGSKAGFETSVNDKGESDLEGSPNNSNQPKDDNSQGQDEKSHFEDNKPTVKQMQMYYSRILFYAFLSPQNEKNLSDIISHIDENRRLARHLELKKPILEAIKSHINPFILATLDNKIENIRDLRDERNEDGENTLKAIAKFGRISASEVFTPIRVAKMMVDNLIDDEFIKDYKENPKNIIDLSTKSGVYLIMVYHKLVNAGISVELVKDNLYAVATSHVGYEFTRAVYEDFGWNLNHLADSDVMNSYRLIEDNDFNGKLEEVFGGRKMDFDVVIGNPPYQSKTKKLLYPDFYLGAREISKSLSLIFPTGWQAPKNNNGLQKLNKPEIKEDSQIVFVDNQHNVFPGVAGAEWTNIILWKKGYDNGLDGKQKILFNGKNPEITKLPLETSEIEKPEEIKELERIVTSTKGFASIRQITTARKPYGLATDYLKTGSKNELSLIHADRKSDEDIKIYVTSKKSVYAEASFPFPRVAPAFENYKVFIPDAWGNMSKAGLGGAYADIIIAFPKEATLGTYVESGNFTNFRIAQKHAKYFMTKFFRALLYANKHSIINSSAWVAVPCQSYKEDFWDSNISEIDEALFEKYEIPDNIRQFVRTNIQTKEEKNIVNFDKKEKAPN